MNVLGILALCFAPHAPWTAPEPAASLDDAAALIEELEKKTDNAEASEVNALANLKTEEALEGLIKLYPKMQSIYMRRAVLQGLTLFDAVPGLEQRALQPLLDAATNSSEHELRLMAVDLLARCRNFGKAHLAMIVDSEADDEVRERAFYHHTSEPRPEDLAWYREVYDPERKEAKKKAAKKDDDAQIRHTPKKLREFAFDALVGAMDASEVVAATEDKYNWKIRKRALDELHARSHGDTYEAAERIWEERGERAEFRVHAASIMLALDQKSILSDLQKEMTRLKDGEHELGVGLARLLSGLNDPDVNKSLLKDVGKGKGLRKVMSFYAVAQLDDPKVDKALMKGLKDKDERVVDAAIALLAERKNKEALDDLQKMLDKDKTGRLAPLIVDAMAEIRRGESEWALKLVEFAKSDDPAVRNNALVELGQTKNTEYLPTIVAALDHELWSTRLAAAKAIEAMRAVQGVGAIATRIAKEDGRMLSEMSEILFRLTGMPFGENGRLWGKWWGDEGDGFKIPSQSELDKIARNIEERRLRQISKSTFFGVRIASKRVIFIIDVSGSMQEPTRGKYVGEAGEIRMEVAKRELLKCLDGLERDSFFNIVTFSGGVMPWQDTISELTPETLAAAKQFVGRLGPAGGTNLYGALRAAFEDQEVDTIFVLSDGEPSVGDVIDPFTIRQDVIDWNANRGVVINCIAVGGSFQVLEWIAEDNNGTHVHIP